eukprot:scaffold6508_cov103-Isochrysis_galbana.AAC.3
MALSGICSAGWFSTLKVTALPSTVTSPQFHPFQEKGTSSSSTSNTFDTERRKHCEADSIFRSGGPDGQHGRPPRFVSGMRAVFCDATRPSWEGTCERNPTKLEHASIWRGLGPLHAAQIGLRDGDDVARRPGFPAEATRVHPQRAQVLLAMLILAGEEDIAKLQGVSSPLSKMAARESVRKIKQHPAAQCSPRTAPAASPAQRPSRRRP